MWRIVLGPEPCNVGNFDGDVHIYRVENDEGLTKAVYVRFRGTLLAGDKGAYPDEVTEAIQTNGRSVIDRRASAQNIPKCITFSPGVAEPYETEDCPNPCSEP